MLQKWQHIVYLYIEIFLTLWSNKSCLFTSKQAQLKPSKSFVKPLKDKCFTWIHSIEQRQWKQQLWYFIHLLLLFCISCLCIQILRLSCYILTHLDFSHCRTFWGKPICLWSEKVWRSEEVVLGAFFLAQQQNSMTAKLFVDNSTSAGETYMFLPTWVRAFTPQFI